MVMVKISDQPKLSIGLLGVGVPAELHDKPQLWSPFRLNEIERRIVAIEAKLAALMPDMS